METDATQVLWEVFGGLERLAPGSEASTRRALELARSAREPARILDAGCGTGASTVVLLRETQAQVLGVDTHAPALDTLRSRAEGLRAADRLETRVGSIGELADARESFDVIWCEGAIYTIGFDVGLRDWRRLLAPGGVLACSELCWIRPNPSARAKEFMGKEYPAIRSTEGNVAAAEHAGYRLIEHFVLPESDWTESYYAPVARRVEEVRAIHQNDEAAGQVLSAIEKEIRMYDLCRSDYGYVFYVFQRVE